jgi:hypothetical protein
VQHVNRPHSKWLTYETEHVHAIGDVVTCPGNYTTHGRDFSARVMALSSDYEGMCMRLVEEPLAPVRTKSVEAPVRPAVYILVKVDPSYVPEDGDAFDAVVAALDHFDITAVLHTGTAPALADLLTRGV